MRALTFSIDDNYVIPFQVLWNSLISTKSIKSKNPIFILHDSSLSENSIKKLKIFSKKYGFTFNFKFTETFIEKNFLIRDIDHVTNAAYFRLLVSDILPKEITSVLYLDCDIIAVRSLKKLLSIKLKNPIAATDHLSYEDSIRLWQNDSFKYFQSGVLLMDLRKFRENKYIDKFRKIINDPSYKLIWHDQDILNIVFKDNWQELPIWFNTCFNVRDKYPERIIKDKSILLHFDGGRKPWNFFSNDFAYKIWYENYKDTFKMNFGKNKIKRSLWEILKACLKRLKLILKLAYRKLIS